VKPPTSTLSSFVSTFRTLSLAAAFSVALLQFFINPFIPTPTPPDLKGSPTRAARLVAGDIFGCQSTSAAEKFVRSNAVCPRIGHEELFLRERSSLSGSSGEETLGVASPRKQFEKEASEIEPSSSTSEKSHAFSWNPDEIFPESSTLSGSISLSEYTSKIITTQQTPNMSLVEKATRIAEELEYSPEQVRKGVEEFLRLMGELVVSV